MRRSGGDCSARVVLVFLWMSVWLVPAPAEAQDGSRFLRWAYQDAATLVTEVGPEVPLYALGGAAVLVPMSTFDPALREEVQEGYEGAWARYLDATNMLGDKEIVFPASALFAVSLATDDTHFQDAAFTSLQSVVYSGLLTSGLKTVFGRFRPFRGEGPYQFAPFGGTTSFPSGHATAAFAVVTPWVMYYPGPFTYGLFALSTGTAIARIAQDRHWATDVLAGSAIGFFVGYWLSREHQGADAMLTGDEVYVLPAVGAGQIALRVRIPLN